MDRPILVTSRLMTQGKVTGCRTRCVNSVAHARGRAFFKSGPVVARRAVSRNRLSASAANTNPHGSAWNSTWRGVAIFLTFVG